MTRQTFASRGITKPYLGFLVWVGVAMALVMAIPGRAMAAEIIVTSSADNTLDNGLCTLRDAITAANTNTATGGCVAGDGADTITFTLSGPFPVTIILGSGLPFITDAQGLTINGGSQVAISGNSLYRVFTIEDFGASLTLENLTVQNGRADPSNGCEGGGILNYGTLTVINSRLTGNSAICGETGRLGNGGGIKNSGTLTVIDSTLTDNSATGVQPTTGGGIDNGGKADVINSTLSGNSAWQGGGIVNSHYGKMTVTNSTLSDNRTLAPGGTGDGGGGIFNGGEITITHSTLAGNSSAGLDNGQGGGGIFNGGTLRITNSLVVNSPRGLNCVNFLGASFTATGNNMATDNMGTDSSCQTLAPLNFATVTTDALKLGALADNGGPTKTHALLADSVAIDAGDPLKCEATDQRGVLRDPLHCDIGAFEFNAEIQGLIDRVRASVPTPQAAGLIAKLQAALAAQSGGRTGPACNQMRAFINQVTALVANNTLLPEAGAALIRDAQAIQAAIGCSV